MRMKKTHEVGWIVSTNIKRLMKEKGYTMQDMADKMEIKSKWSDRAMSIILQATEKKGSINIEKLARIAKILEVDITELFKR